MEEQKPDCSKKIKDLFSVEAIEHARAARSELIKSLENIFPPGFTSHQRAARKELLLAARSFIDNALQNLETKDKAA